MGKVTGFLEYTRQLPARRPAEKRVHDWNEVYEPFPENRARIQAARCMDCGIPFCHLGCPLGNLIPEWNDLVYRGHWREASDRLHATNNFPEFTGRLCPAPCEAACVLGIADDPVTIERMEYEIVETAWSNGWVTTIPPEIESGKSVAIVGSGPAGLACAQQLRRAGHRVTVYERDSRPGGLLRYGIPEFKMEKRVVDRRLEQLSDEGIEFVCDTYVGIDSYTSDGAYYGWDATKKNRISARELLNNYDAIVLAIGTGLSRDLAIPGRDLGGIHYALEYLRPSNLLREGTRCETFISAEGRDVVILGGGDTGADCLGTVHRQGARSVLQLEILPKPPLDRPLDQPWPTYPMIFRTTSAHEEGGERYYSLNTKEFIGDAAGNLSGILVEEVSMDYQDGRPVFYSIEGTMRVIECNLALLALGFTGPEQAGAASELGLEFNSRGNIIVDSNWMATTERVFSCGDAARGQSLIVWAIAEGRSAAQSVDAFLTGHPSMLPAPVRPGDLAIR